MDIVPAKALWEIPREFWAQLVVGVVSGVGTLVGMLFVSGAERWAPVGILAVMAWLVICVATLLVLERHKPGTPRPTNDARPWAQQVHDLRMSRTEIVTAYEIERRRIERDLHDGAQQHLVVLSMKVGEAAALVEPAASRPVDLTPIAALLAQAQDAAETALHSLRETVSGLHPKVLSDLGLEAAVRDLATGSALTVTVRVPYPLPVIPEGVVTAAYYVASEALTNVSKHAPQAQVSILVAADETLLVSVIDDGTGGAAFVSGHGLVGMAERLAAFGGTLDLHSPTGGPTTLSAHIPLLLTPGQPGAPIDPSLTANDAR